MGGKAIARRTDSLIGVVEVELSRFEDRGWTGDDALGAADSLAKAEYGNEVLRAIGEEISDVDGHNRITACASTARRTTAAIFDIVNESSIVPRSGTPLLSDVSGDNALETADGAKVAYGLIEALFEEVIEDASSSLETAGQREEAIGLYQRDNGVTDEDGTVWFGAMSGQIGITRETLTAEPSARNWGLEFANDIAGIAAYVEGVADNEELANLREPITEKLVSSAVSSVILGQGFGLVERWAAVFFEDALPNCYELTEEGCSDFDAEDLTDYQTECRKALKRLLETARDFAAGVTAYAALASALEQAGLT